MEQPPLLIFGHPAEHFHAVALEEVGLDLLLGRTRHSEARVDTGAVQGLEGAQEDRQALALIRPAHEEQPQVVGLLLRTARRRRQVNSVRHDAVCPAVEALGRPAGGLRHGNARVQLRVHATGVKDVRREAVDEPAGGVAVERSDHRHACGLDGKPADDRRIRLVHVDHVEAGIAHGAAQHARCVRRERQVRHRTVGRDADGAPERNEVVRHLARVRARAPVHGACQPVVRVVGSEHADVVAATDELLCSGLDVPAHPPWIRVRVRGNERYAQHLRHPSPPFRPRHLNPGPPSRLSPARRAGRPARCERSRSQIAIATSRPRT